MRHILPCILYALLTLSRADSEIPATTPEGYAVPQPGMKVTFPRDHGSHPDYKIEWWYVTGHLTDNTGEEHGFQLTFFRRALRPPAERDRSTSAFGRNHLHMAHAAWVERNADRFTAEERLAREGWDAGASTERLNVHQSGWRLRALDDSANPEMRARFTVRDRIKTTLTFDPAKPFVRFGENGVERKGADPTAASLYLTFTRLNVTGTLQVNGEERSVTGEAWMDHEISSSQLGESQVGWDWASIQLKDGREIMMYILRRKDGSVDPYSVLYWIDREGKTTGVDPGEFSWKPVRTWTSPVTGAVYPVDADLTVTDPETGTPVTLQVRTIRDAQEHDGRLGGIPYWEGASRVSANNRPVGKAYVELTGYAESIEDALR